MSGRSVIPRMSTPITTPEVPCLIAPALAYDCAKAKLAVR